MGRLALDLTNKRFGSLVAQYRQGSDAAGNAVWLCLCDCGAQHVARSAALRVGGVRRCHRCTTMNIRPPIDTAIQVDLYYYAAGEEGGFAIARDADRSVLALTPWSKQRHRLSGPAIGHKLAKWTLARLVEREAIRPAHDKEGTIRHAQRAGIVFAAHLFQPWDKLRALWLDAGGDPLAMHPAAERRGAVREAPVSLPASAQVQV